MPTPLIEYRSFRKLELREAKKDGVIGTLVGYAAVFNSESADFGGWREVLRPGCFSRSLTELPYVRALYQHNVAQVLGRRGANTLAVREDDHGLHVEIELIDTQFNQDVLANVRSGNLDAMSFGMVAKKYEWDIDEERGYDLRVLSDVDLFEVSVVTWPAYEETEVAARSLQTFKEQRSAKPTTPFRLLRLRQARLKINNT